jgi:drug/metabolite transporter (DMT)-like permease
MSTRTRGLLEGLGAGLAFGSASIFIRYLILFDVNIYAIAFFRLLIATGILSLIILLMSRYGNVAIPRVDIKTLIYIVSMGIVIGLHFIFFISAVRDTYIVNATVLVNTTPILTLILGALLFKVSISKWDVQIVTVAFLGAALLALQDLHLTGSLIGDIEAILAAFFQALYLNIGKKIRGSTHILLIMAIVYIAAIPVIFLASVIEGINLFQFSYTHTVILLMFAVGAIPTAIGHTLYVSSLKGLKSFETATLGLLEPLSASILAYILFFESPGILSIIGASLVLASIFMISYRERR